MCSIQRICRYKRTLVLVSCRRCWTRHKYKPVAWVGALQWAPRPEWPAPRPELWDANASAGPPACQSELPLCTDRVYSSPAKSSTIKMQTEFLITKLVPSEGAVGWCGGRWWAVGGGRYFRQKSHGGHSYAFSARQSTHRRWTLFDVIGLRVCGHIGK